MKYHVDFRFDFEHPPCSHKLVVSALDKDDAERVVKYIHAKNGNHVVIIRCFKIERESNKMHNNYIGRRLR